MAVDQRKHSLFWRMLASGVQELRSMRGDGDEFFAVFMLGLVLLLAGGVIAMAVFAAVGAVQVFMEQPLVASLWTGAGLVALAIGWVIWRLADPEEDA